MEQAGAYYSEPNADAGLSWHDDDLAFQGIFEPPIDERPGWRGVAHAVHVFVFSDLETLHRVVGKADISAYSITYDGPDSRGVGALIFLVRGAALSTIIHECTHVALFWARRRVRRKQRAHRWLSTHPEHVPEVVGDLSAILYFSLPADLLDNGQD